MPFVWVKDISGVCLGSFKFWNTSIPAYWRTEIRVLFLLKRLTQPWHNTLTELPLAAVEIWIQIYALAMGKHAWAAHTWRLCWTCPYWVSWLVSDNCSRAVTSRGISKSLNATEWWGLTPVSVSYFSLPFSSLLHLFTEPVLLKSASTNLYEMYPPPYWNVHQQLRSVISLWICIWLQAKWLKVRQHDFQEGKFWVLGVFLSYVLIPLVWICGPQSASLVSSLCLCLAALFWFPEPVGIWKWFFFENPSFH